MSKLCKNMNNNINLAVQFKILAGILVFFSPMATIIYVMCFLVTLDFVTKIVSILKSNARLPIVERIHLIKSKSIKVTPLKLVFYNLFLMAIFGMEMAIFRQEVYLTRFAAFWFYLTEIYSISENLRICTGTNVFTVIIRMIRKYFEKKISEFLSDDFEINDDDLKQNS